MSLVTELKRRNVFRVATAYVVAGWLLTEVLTTVLPALGAPAWASRAVILVFALGFLPTLAFSWVYELTPEGIRKQSELDRDGSAQPPSGRRLEYVTVAVVVAGIVFLAVFGSRLSPESPGTISNAVVPEASVAVLPFVNMSNDPENEYFSDGLTETLLHILSQIPDLKVAARTSSFSFKHQNKTIGEIAKELGVAHVLEGSVQRSGNQVRITAQLIRAKDDFHVWSANFDRTFEDIFAIQDEIAAKVGGALSASILGAAGGNRLAGINTSDTDAYDLYLRALGERATYSYWGLQGSEKLLKASLTIDPDFLAAKTELASNYLHQVETGLMDELVAYPLITAITEQVLEVRPDDIEARSIRLFAETGLRSYESSPESMQQTVRQLEGLIAEDPAQLQPRILLTRLFRRLQQLDKALPIQLAALERDPLNPRILYELGTLYTALNHWDEARAALEKSLAIEPNQPNAYATLGAISLAAGEGVGYLKNFLKAVEVDPTDHELPGAIAIFLYNLGLIEEGDDFRDRVMAIAPTSEIAYRITLERAVNTGDVQGCVASARRAIEDNVNNRRKTFSTAVQELLRIAVRRGTVATEIDYIEQRAPGIFDIESTALPLKYRSAQYAALDAWYATLSAEELDKRLVELQDVARSFGIDPLDDPGTRFTVLALRGDIEGAIEVALNEIAGDSALLHPGWQRALEQQQYAAIVADTRIQTVLQRWQHEEAEVRNRIRAYLSDLRAST